MQDDLRRAGIKPWAWVINSSLTTATVISPLLRQRAAQEWPQIEAVSDQHAQRVALAPLQAQEPVGVERLQALAGGHFQD